MSEKDISWFHCGRCGSLFQSPAGENANRLCPSCGCNPSLTMEPAAAEGTSGGAAESTAAGEKPKRGTKKRRRSGLMPKLVIGWLLLLAAIIFGARLAMNRESTGQSEEPDQSAVEIARSGQDEALLSEATPKVIGAFSQFLTAVTPEARGQFVIDPLATAGKMGRFYGLNPLVAIDPQTLRLAANAVVHIPGRRAIETQWKSNDGRVLDATFLEENGEWRLDWEDYVRFSEHPWTLFLAGSEADRGEFRLLARERLAEERKNDADISVVLYAPRFGQPAETGPQSPEFLVPRNSRNGRLLDAAFKLERSGGRVFGNRNPSLNPEGHIRVRVKVRRSEANMERRFEIEEVVACHWFSVADPGVEIQEK